MNSLYPDHRYPSLAEIPIEEFAGKGFRGALIDIDNTLVPYGEYDAIPDDCIAWLKRAADSGVQCLLYSNATQWKIDKLGKITGLPGVPKVYKPAFFHLKTAMKILGLEKKELLMIGDQWCTDILGGRLGGVETILVEPLTKKDWIGTKLLRIIEWTVIPDRRPWYRKK